MPSKGAPPGVVVFEDEDDIVAKGASALVTVSADLVKKFEKQSYSFDSNFHGITPLYESRADADVDIVAVPGLGSHAIGSWKWPGSNAVWLRDFLPRDVPDIRVLVYGYDTSLLGSMSKDSIEHLGIRFLESLKAFREGTSTDQRPIIFIGHSLGGLVVKEALVQASKTSGDHQNDNLRNSCNGLLLFGVPNLGLRHEQLLSIVQGQPNALLIRDLVVDNDSEPSPFLSRISKDFSDCCKGRYKAISFFERDLSPTAELQPESGKLMMTGGPMLLVTAKSATSTGLTAAADEENIPLKTDHTGLVKYQNGDQEGYTIVRNKLKKLVKEAQSHIPGRFTEDYSNRLEAKQQPLFTVPFERDRKIVGREDVMLEIERKRATESRVALVGLAGVGKSQIAIEYAYRLQKMAPQTSVLWVRAGSADRFKQGYRDISAKLNLPGGDDPESNTLWLVCEWLRDERNGPWFMVLDSADDADVLYDPDEENSRLSEYIPQTPNGFVLVTSCNLWAARNIVGVSDNNIIRVDTMNETDALAMLRDKVPSPEAQKDDAMKLVRALEYIPLAISQAAAYLSLDLRRDTKTKPGDAAVILTWQISFEQIRRTSQEAANLLALMSMFDSQDIPESLLMGNMDRLKFETIAVEPLTSFSLVRSQIGRQSFDMHQLVQVATRSWLEQKGEHLRWRREALRTVAGKLPGGNYGTWKDERGGKRGRSLDRAAVANNTGWYLFNIGEYASAEKFSQTAVDERKRVLGKEHLDTLTSRSNLAYTLRHQAKFEQAKDILQDVLRIKEMVLGEDDPSTLASRDGLALVLQDKGRYEEAEAIYRQAFEKRVKVLGEDHAETLTNADNLGITLRRQEKLEEAEAMHRRALEGRERMGPEHPDTLTSVNNLAMVLRRQERYHEAERLLQRALEGRETVVGKEHPKTLTTVDNLALIKAALGKFKEAKEGHERAVRGRERVLGMEHTDTLTSVYNLAWVFQDLGDYEKAEEMLRRTLHGEEKTLGKGHRNFLKTVRSLANVLIRLGKREEADSLAEEYGVDLDNS
ncbi:hypothetical protein QBC46DRAFT_430783 [Diplogelasinospora grovesii]|uniref:DUF7779 domain-containing protein n=1 Tax=Diplogelasinospora grovesii TaxID=303347 RepID=A0AAN6N961_9PEZI|nr:hypothetical protein QBC46DRAFT_430783 [Diplogelasinospora grovesii]